jgi:uncharacterized protein YggE
MINKINMIARRYSMFSHKFFSKVLMIGALLVLVAGCAAAPSELASSSAGAPSTSSQGSNNPASSALGSSNSQSISPVVQTTSGNGGGITVTGTGAVSGTPDMVQVSVGVVTQGATVQDAVSANASQMSTLLSALKADGIAETDIQTSNYNVSSQNNPKPIAPGSTATTEATYYVNNQVQVTLHDVSKLGDLLDKLVAAGANNIYGVSFGISDTSQLEDQARAKAVQDATNKAQSLAKLEGVTLGNVISVSETSGYPGPVYAAAAGIGGGGTPIQPGQLQVSVNLQVTYAIK